MTKLVWDPLQAPSVKSGLDRGVLYLRSYAPMVWNGISAVTEKSESDLVEGYFDGQKYAYQRPPETFRATVEAYTYPYQLDLVSQFDLSYRVALTTGYEIHLVYNAVALPGNPAHVSINPQADAIKFSWDIATVPVSIDQYRSTAHLVINSNYTDAVVLGLIENLLYGTVSTAPSMPTAAQIFAIFEAHATFVIVDLGDGTFTATGPDSWFTSIDSTTMDITTPSVEVLDSESYRIRSW